MPKFYSDAEVGSWFAHHPPTTDDVVTAHQVIRDGFRTLALKLNNLLPEGPDKSRTLQDLREVMYLANACVAVAQDVFHDEPTA